jgi:hypothetical protein
LHYLRCVASMMITATGVPALELLSILYAMLAALTGLSAGGESVAVRQPVVASAGAGVEQVAIAATVRTMPGAVSGLGRWMGRMDQRPANDRATGVLLLTLTRFAQIDFGRWHE